MTTKSASASAPAPAFADAEAVATVPVASEPASVLLSPIQAAVEIPAPAAHIPPDGGYGWVCVACVFWINANTWGINSSYGVFLSYYLSHNVFPDTSVLSYAFTGGLSISCALLVAPLATYLIHLCGTRFVLNLGVFFETLSMIGSSFAKRKWQIFLSQGVCFGWGMGFLFVGSVGIIPQWFLRRRSVAMGITAAGSGLGGLIYSLAVGAIIPALSLAWTFRILGIISCAMNLVAANLVRDRNKAVGSRLSAFHLPLFNRPEFLLFLGWGVLTMLGYVGVLFSLSSFALSVGLSPHQASIVNALLNLGQGLGRPFVGMFSDRLGRINVATSLSLLCALFCLLIWVFAHSMGLVSFFAILVGTVAGTYWATVSPVLAEIIGLKELPSGLSITWITLVPPTTVAEPIALLLRNTVSHDAAFLPVQLFTGFMYIGAALCLWVVRGWKVGDLLKAKEEESPYYSSSSSSGPAATETTTAAGYPSPASAINQSDDAIAEQLDAVDAEVMVDKKGSSQVTAAGVVSDSIATVPPVRPWSPAGLARRMVALKRV